MPAVGLAVREVGESAILPVRSHNWCLPWSYDRHVRHTPRHRSDSGRAAHVAAAPRQASRARHRSRLRGRPVLDAYARISKSPEGDLEKTDRQLFDILRKAANRQRAFIYQLCRDHAQEWDEQLVEREESARREYLTALSQLCETQIRLEQDRISAHCWNDPTRTDASTITASSPAGLMCESATSAIHGRTFTTTSWPMAKSPRAPPRGRRQRMKEM